LSGFKFCQRQNLPRRAERPRMSENAMPFPHAIVNNLN
jgi:hypothetical protein